MEPLIKSPFIKNYRYSMKKAKRPLLSSIPAWALSLITLVVSLLFLFIIAAVIGSLKIFSYGWNEIIAYLLYDILITFACFTICRRYPKSVWYTPVICGAPIIFVAFFEPNFWVTAWGVVFGIGFVLCLIGAITGAILGRRVSSRDTIS